MLGGGNAKQRREGRTPKLMQMVWYIRGCRFVLREFKVADTRILTERHYCHPGTSMAFTRVLPSHQPRGALAGVVVSGLTRALAVPLDPLAN